MRVFVTGATGTVGRRLVPLLLGAGHAVTAVARSRAKRAALERRGVAAVPLDLFNREAAKRAVAGHDAVVNLATHIPHSSLRLLLPGAFAVNDRIRRDGSANLVDAALAAGATRFVQESFAPIYEDRGDEWIDEDSPVRPVRYNRTVLDAERSAARCAAAGGVGVVLRFAGFYGPDAFQVHDLISAIRRGFAPVPGPPGAFLSSISHDDAATACLAALSLPCGVYNVADDEPLTRRAYVDAAAAALGVPSPRLPPRWAGRLMGSLGELLSRSQRISNAKLRRASGGWSPRYPSAREGWLATVAQLRTAPELGRAASAHGAG